jgi:hypothetical protein
MPVSDVPLHLIVLGGGYVLWVTETVRIEEDLLAH